MSGPLDGRHLVLGVTGSIAAYKAAELTSRLVQAGAIVDVAMTAHAAEFITPLTFRALTGRAPYLDMFRDGAEGEVHVELARRADLMLIAPATASSMARLAHGLADDMVSLTALATQAPLLVAPAMDSQMWEHPATQANRALLEQRGVQFVGPAAGRLASGRRGAGRLVEPETIVDFVKARLGRERGDLAGRRIVVTAGGTREAVDPVRYLSNRSSGKQGYALAEAARDRGAQVTLVSTAALPAPGGVTVVAVESAAEMLAAVREAVRGADVLIMAAAVADYRPAEPAEQKIKRADMGSELSVPLVENPDISKEVDGPFVKVVFAAETQDLITNATKKLVAKGAKLIVANDVSATDAGFASDDNRVTILDAEGGREDLPLLPKYEVSGRILDRVAALLR
ncbi:MAG: bifunctional phosphopantothenoylcysteine decarboxylase/phosphopantothenate--cysteine ligase CoaBC [Chloroflexi bacterium]|nr:MAG: bifunctional phosphopantothenoylcysteine decarboxylase/phosphopantothenate--cysteine ligase CoaBC [Chloroflexota bacterium]